MERCVHTSAHKPSKPPPSVRLPRLPSSLVPSVLDTACASLATFGVGLFAARAYPVEVLGLYELFFLMWLLAALVPRQLVMLPTEIRAAQMPPEQRMGLLDAGLRRAVAPGVVAGAVGVVITAAVAPRIGSGALWPLAVTTLAATVLSPLQDHLRYTLHIAERSWGAAQVSMVQLSSVLAALGLLLLLDVPAGFVPFGALAAANVVSLTVGMRMNAAARASERVPAPPIAELLQTGRWLLPQAVGSFLGTYLAGLVVTFLAGAASLGYASAARLAAQPVFVLIQGLTSVLGPRSLAAAAEMRYDEVLRLRRQFIGAALGASTVYLALVAVPSPLNPLPVLLPLAYVVPGLVAVSVAANMLAALSSPQRYELLGRGRERWLAGAQGAGGVVQVVTAAATAALGAFARPLSLLVQNLALAGIFWRATRQRALGRHIAGRE